MTAADWSTVAPIAISLAALAWAIYSQRSAARKKALDELTARIATAEGALAEHKDEGQKARYQLRERVGAMETALLQMPDKDVVHRLDVSVTEIRGDIKAMAEGFRAMSHTTRRIDDYLMAQAKGGKDK